MENDPKQLISIDPAAEDHTVISCVGKDFSSLENRLTDLGILYDTTPEAASAAYYKQQHEVMGQWTAQVSQRLQDFAQQLVRSFVPVKRRRSEPKATYKASSARKRKRALQSRYSYGRRTLTWVMPSTESRRVSSAQMHTSQVPKHSYIPTGRLNATSPAEQHIPKKTAGATDTLKSQEAQ